MSLLPNSTKPAGYYPPDFSKTASGESLRGFAETLNDVGITAAASVAAYYNARAGVETAKAAAKHKGSGYDYGAPLLPGARLPESTRAQQEYAATAAVNAVADQTKRIGSELISAHGGKLALIAGGIYLLLRKG